MLSILFALLILTSFSACTRTVYVDNPIEIKIPVKCVVADVECQLNGSDAEVVLGLTKCIIDLKKEAEVCK